LRGVALEYSWFRAWKLEREESGRDSGLGEALTSG
jgi:hypothetical protein